MLQVYAYGHLISDQDSGNTGVITTTHVVVIEHQLLIMARPTPVITTKSAIQSNRQFIKKRAAFDTVSDLKL